MLRISQTTDGSPIATCRVEGYLVSEWVDCLDEVCSHLLAGPGHVVLDLGGLGYADEHGLALLRKLPRARVSIVNCNPLIQHLVFQDGMLS